MDSKNLDPLNPLRSLPAAQALHGLHYANESLHSIDNGNRRLSNFLKSPDKVASSSAVEPPSPPTFGVNSITTFVVADLLTRRY